VGAAAIFARYALTSAGPLAVAASRLCVASAVLLVIAALRPWQHLDRNTYLRLGIAGAALAVHFASWIASLDDTSVAISVLLVSTAPLWNAAYDGLVLKRRFPWTVPAALAAGIAGLAIIVSQHNAPAPYPGHELLGAALALTGAVAFSVYLAAVRGVRRDAGTRTIVTVTYGVAATLLVVTAALAHQAPPPLTAKAAWGGILAMALVSQLLGHTAMNAALRWFSATTVAVTTMLEPVFAALVALAVFGEGLSPIEIGGAAVLLASVGAILWTTPNEELA
jgi:drug/metabolite transporter (DMT)-like permease